MIARLRDLAHRPVHELHAGAVLAVCALAIVIGAVLLAQIGDPEDAPPPARPAPEAAPTTVEVTNPPVVSHETHPSEHRDDAARTTPHDARDIRTSTRRFLAGYLHFTDGHGAAIDLTNATRELIARLEQDPPRPSPEGPDRRPRVQAVRIDQSGAAHAAAAALIDDTVTRYLLRLELVRTGAEEWSVTDLGPG